MLSGADNNSLELLNYNFENPNPNINWNLDFFWFMLHNLWQNIVGNIF
ncbi:hypothetical protein RC62_3284 [Flavobacterium aquidurense]|uniref:Uncharacterized protein n=1 Tax=Flavobacterium aquidurense TaxID=362413 RepID=A0A0Q0X1L8_9FLAO|nr:hypothetical protein RC62_3284 [Flavobacterium aquidurense]